MSGEPLLQASRLCCRYGRTDILHDIDFTIAPGEVVGLVGPNGSGKSTLLKCLAGLRPLSAGSLTVQGRALKRLHRNELARVMAYVPQHTGPAMSLRVIDMVTLGRLPHRGGASNAEDQHAVLGAIERMGLQALVLRHFSELSGGERQRVMIARALAQQGRLLLFDEPTSDLDLRHQLAVMQTVRELAGADGVSSVIAIHDLALAARFCDRLLLLREGRVHDQGPCADVFTPANLEALFDVGVQVGMHGGAGTGLPYVIPMTRSH